jgi:acetyl-CoA carboxylase beta subunit
MFSEDLPETTPESKPKRQAVIHDHSGRKVVLSCQSCRKLKNHIEIEPNLFQCVKCKRQVDIRVS